MSEDQSTSQNGDSSKFKHQDEKHRGVPKVVLWLEEEPESVSSITDHLQETGWQVEVSDNLQDFRRLIEEKDFSVFVTDLRLGSSETESSRVFESIKELKASRLPVVALTNTEEIDPRAIESGVEVYLRKPCAPERLRDVIETIRIRQDLEQRRKPVFVAHEFSRQQRDDLRSALGAAFEGTPFTLYYADADIRVGHILLGKIIERIKTTEFGIYDISSGGRPNVFLELGIAIGVGKPYYIIARTGSEIPADLAGLDRIEYESFRDLTEQVRQKIVPRHS